MRVFVLLLLAAVPLAGCTHRVAIGVETTPADRARFAESVADYPAVALLRSGDSIPIAATVSLGPTALLYGGPFTEERIPLRQVESIRFRSRQAGGWSGAGVGLLVGSGFGAMVGLTNLCDDCDRTAFVFTLAAGFGLVGLTAGSVVGALIGSTYEYTVEQESERGR